MIIEARSRSTSETFISEVPLRVSDIISMLGAKPEYAIYLCRIRTHTASLNTVIDHDCTVDLLDLRDASANMTYQVSLSYMFVKAVRDLFGKDVWVSIDNSLSKGLFTRIGIDPVTDETAEMIEARMRELQRQNIPFEAQWLEREEAAEYLRKNMGREELRELFKTAKDLKGGYLYRLDDMAEIFCHFLVPHTGYLKLFEVKKYRNGLILRFPHPSAPDRLLPYQEQEVLYNAFTEAAGWNRVLHVEYASDLNDIVQLKRHPDMILLSEALHEKRIAAIAEEICSSGKRIVLIAGPSSSGKTTFAKRLCIQLRTLGISPLYLGTDDYFLERDETPLLADGRKDYESIAALDRDLFAKQMNLLLSGAEVDLPAFDFVNGTKKYGERIVSIDASQPVVIEGLHALNPVLTEGVAEEQKFRIYISPLTNLNIDAYNRIPTTDVRFLRRMVRDHQFRNHSARETIVSWPEVRKGEEEYIFPWSKEADVFFNSDCFYELAVLKKYAKPLLEEIDYTMPEYPEALRLLAFLENFRAVEDDSMIPNNSILREFIGGSLLAE